MAVLLLGVVPTSWAQIVVLANSSRAAAFGSAGNVYSGTGIPTYWQSFTGTSLLGDNLGASGHAIWYDAEPHGLSETLTSRYEATSSAGLNWTLGENSITIASDVTAFSSVSLWGPYGPVTAVADSLFQIDFRVLSPSAFRVEVPSWTVFGAAQLDLSLTSLAYGTVIFRDSDHLPYWNNGVLAAGVYRLNYDLRVDGNMGDPMGTDSWASTRVNFSATPVPDAISTGSMVAIGTLIMFLFSHRKTGYRSNSRSAARPAV